MSGRDDRRKKGASKNQLIFSERLGDLIADEKAKTGDGLAKLSAKIGISAGVLSDYQNAYASPGIDKLCEIAKYFGVSTDYLLGLTDRRTHENVDIGQRTGLSDGAIMWLETHKKNLDAGEDDKRISVLNWLLEKDRRPIDAADFANVCTLFSSLVSHITDTPSRFVRRYMTAPAGFNYEEFFNKLSEAEVQALYNSFCDSIMAEISFEIHEANKLYHKDYPEANNADN